MKRFCLLLTTMLIAFTSVMALETTTFTTIEGAVLNVSLSSIGNTATVTGIENTSFKGILNIPLEVEYEGVTYVVVTIGEEAFKNCKMSAVNLGNVSTVGASAFRGCSNIPSLDLSNVKYIGDYAFYMKGSTLTSIKFSGKLQSVGTQAFPQGLGCSVTDVTVNVNDITEIIGLPIPFFYYTTEVKYYVAGELLKEIVIPEGITTLSGFNYIRGINFISLPSTLQNIAENTFTEAQTPKIYCYAKTPPTISDKAHPFIHLDEIELYVPHGRKKAYMMDNWWKSFPNIIEMEGEDEPEYPGDSITVENAGELSNALAAIDKEHITNLVIKGRLNAADIKVIRAAEGKLATLDSLDLSNVTLVPSDEYYYSYTMMMDGSMSPEYYRFFIGTERKDTTWTGETLSMWPPHYHDHYDNNLTAAFEGTNLKRVVLPHSISDIGEKTFRGCGNLQEVIMTNAPTSIGKEAFRDCGSLALIPNINNVKEIGELAFYNCIQLGLFEGTKELDLTSLVTLSASAFCGCKKIQAVRFSDKLRSIGESAFYDCSSLTDVTLPSNLVRLSASSFEKTPFIKYNTESVEGIQYLGTVAIGCDKSLSVVNFREGTLGIADCSWSSYTNVTDIHLPSTLEYIGEYAFRDCSLLKSIVFPESLKEIGQRAFYNSGIESVIIPESIDKICDSAFSGCGALTNVIYNAPQATGSCIYASCNMLSHVTIGDKVHMIPDNAFSDCNMLEDVTIGTSVEVIEHGAFNSCYSLKSIILPSSLRKIGNSAFSGCKQLKEVNLPSDLRIIGKEAFKNCPLENVVIGELIEEVGESSFASAISMEYNAPTIPEGFFEGWKLEKIKIGDKVKLIPQKAFYYCSNLKSVDMGTGVEVIFQEAFSGCRSLSNVAVSTNLKEIGKSSFYNCYDLKQFDFPEGLTTIGDAAFNQCDLRLVNLPEGLQSVGSSSFAYCKSLKEVQLPSTLTSIGGSAFSSCDCLEIVKSYITSPFEIPNTAFPYTIISNGDCTLMVPKGTLDAYKATYAWRLFKNIIEYGDENAIESIASDSSNPFVLYNLNGMKTNGQRGLNIVRYDDGKVKKVIIK